jgi:CubicO group peptidase (beta-lactamase class C family)
MAYEVLEDLVAKVSGKSFEDYVEANILRPLGMTSSTLLLKQADPAKLATGYTRAKDGTVKPISHYPYNRAHTPSSNLHSNIVDMARWAAANLNGGELDGHRVLRTATHDLMWKPANSADNNEYLGISWMLKDSKVEHFVMHGGGDDGFLSRIVLLPTRKLGIITMTNSDDGLARRIWETELFRVLGLERP